MSGQAFNAQQAMDWGLLNQAIAPEQLLGQALSTAQILARNAPLSVRQVKKSIRFGSQMELRTAYRFEIEAYNQLVDTEDRREGVLAFNEKRPPRFKGQ
jgi:enoyl-CoA hydratase/carnithine racemase